MTVPGMAVAGGRAKPAAGSPVEEPWALPEGWRWGSIGEVCSYVSRGRSPTYVSEGGVRIINQKCVRWRGLDVAHAKRTDAAAAARLAPEQTLQAGDVLWNSTGTGTIGRACVVRESDLDEVSVVDSHVTVLRASTVEPFWLRHWIELPFVQNKVMGTGSTNQVELSRDMVLSMPIPLPQRDLQKTILEAMKDLFAHLDDGEAALVRARTDLGTWRKALLKAAVTGELTADWRAANPPTETGADLLARILDERRTRWLAEPCNKGKRYIDPVSPILGDLQKLPSGWAWASLAQVSSECPRSFQSGPFGSALLHSEFQPEGPLVIGIDNVKEGFFSKGSEHRISKKKYRELSRFAVRPNDVLVTVMATIGRTCVVPSNIEDAIVSKHVYRITINPTCVNPNFVMNCLRSNPRTVSYLFSNTRGQTRPGLNKEILESAPIPVAPLDEQITALDYADEKLDCVTGTLEDFDLSLSKNLRQSILSAAFRGDLVA